MPITQTHMLLAKPHVSHQNCEPSLLEMSAKNKTSFTEFHFQKLISISNIHRLHLILVVAPSYC